MWHFASVCVLFQCQPEVPLTGGEAYWRLKELAQQHPPVECQHALSDFDVSNMFKQTRTEQQKTGKPWGKLEAAVCNITQINAVVGERM